MLNLKRWKKLHHTKCNNKTRIYTNISKKQTLKGKNVTIDIERQFIMIKGLINFKDIARVNIY